MKRIDLAGQWTLVREADGSTVSAAVPGDNFSALLAAGTIADPYVGKNELDVQWIGREDWIFRRTLAVGPELLAEDAVFLTFESLDTVADVIVNGVVAGQSDNMFARWRADVKPLLREGDNQIAVRFASPERTAIERAAKLPYPIPSGGAPVESPHRNLLRKVPCHAGWDWGVCLMVSGIYGEASLLATSAAIIDHVYTDQRFVDDRCEVTVQVELTATRELDSQLTLRLDGRETTVPVRLAPGANQISAMIPVECPRRWWPNGYGEQPLYDLDVQVAGCELRKRLGLRQLELETREDEVGLSFAFKVNGVPIFAKGADWIPCDARPAGHTRSAYDDLLSSAVAANMNMLRVWGGGQYERDDFYELCDEKGLLIWQDFMFACSLYPADKAFLASVAAEVTYQVKRLRDYACIALWCGNNENLGAMTWFKESREQRDRYLVDYDRLYEGTIGRLVDQLDPARAYWPCSPCGGRGDYSDCFHMDSRGDMHYWAVWHSGKSFDAYYDVVPRFCSEFGYQSFPSLPAIRSYAEAKDFNVTSPVMEHHQRNGGGNSKIIEMFSRYFRMPNGFANFVYLSQVQQAVAIKMAVDYWRSLRPTCMGTLYWQLNDNWPVCSWASLEYGGGWKLLHYFARRFYAPLVAVAWQKAGTVEVRVVNDRLTAVAGEVVLRVMDFAGRTLNSIARPVAVEAAASLLVDRWTVAELTDTPEASFLQVELATAAGASANTHFFTPWKACDLAAPAIDCRATLDADGRPSVRLASDRPAFFVALEAEGTPGVYDDNGFTLLPGQPRDIGFSPKGEFDFARWQASLRVYHLQASYG